MRPSFSGNQSTGSAVRKIATRWQTFLMHNFSLNPIVNTQENSMKLLKMLVGFAVALSFASSATAQTFKETATCKLTNTAESKTLYEGTCKVTQSQSGKNTIFSIKMGHKTEPFMFAGVRGEKQWMHGPEETQFTDLPKGGIFKWSNFALVVAE
jgi:hypothetical protein